MKAKDQPRLDVLRSLKSAIFQKEVSKRKEGKAELSEEEVIDVIMKSAKQRKDSIQQYKDAGREELASKEEEELIIIESYLPEMLDEQQIEELVRKVIQQTGAEGMKDMGTVMGKVMPEVKGKADGNAVNRIVKSELSRL